MDIVMNVGGLGGTVSEAAKVTESYPEHPLAKEPWTGCGDDDGFLVRAVGVVAHVFALDGRHELLCRCHAEASTTEVKSVGRSLDVVTSREQILPILALLDPQGPFLHLGVRYEGALADVHGGQGLDLSDHHRFHRAPVTS